MRLFAVLALTALIGFVRPAAAEVDTLRVSKQFGIGYLQQILMEDLKTIEKHAERLGLKTKVEWSTFRSSDVMIEALLSDTLDIASLGLPGLALIADRTRGRLDVKGLAGLNVIDLVLTVRKPGINTLKDFTTNDRIALPAVKVSNQAILLQMAAAKLYGEAEWAKLDGLTVSMAHPDATAAMIGGQSEIVANFSSPPFSYRQLKAPGIRKIATSNEIVGGPWSFNAFGANSKFREQNPKTVAAFLAALDETTAAIVKDKRWAAENYLRITKDRASIEDILEILEDPANRYTTKPEGVKTWVDFMVKVGTLKQAPAKWEDIFHPEAFRAGQN
jgi:NitT/TauT family transport system substrate-binding protein